jgi:hypothetical protein
VNGRRLPDGSHALDCDPGDYWRVKRDGEWIWMCCTPNGMAGDLTQHDVTEHPDGTITVLPSILVQGEHEWHGYLENGVWRSV